MALMQPTLKIERDDPARARACWRCTSRSTGSRSAPQVEVWGDTRRGLRHGRRCARSGSAISSAGRCAWRASIPRRRASPIARWTGAIEAENAFQDGFPLLVASSRVARRSEPAARAAPAQPPVTMARFRPEPRPRRPRRARRGPSRRDRLRHRRGPGAAQAGQAVRPLPDPRRRSRAPASPATRSATCCRTTAPTRAWAARSRSA